MTTSNPSPRKIRQAMAAAQGERRLHSGRGRGAERARSVRRREGSGRRRGRGHRRGGGDAQRHSRRATAPWRSRRLIDTLPNLKLRGMLSYDGGVQHVKGFAARKERALKTIEANAATFAAMKKAGLNTEIFSGGGTGTYNIMHLVPGFTDVQVGSYIFMDMQYLAIGSEDGRRGVQGLRAVADGHDDGDEQPVPGSVRDGRGHEGAHAEQAECRRDRRAGHGLHRRLGRVRLDQVREAPAATRSATSSS